MMAKELSEVERDFVEALGKITAKQAGEQGWPLWQVREVLIVAFDEEAARIATESSATASMGEIGPSD